MKFGHMHDPYYIMFQDNSIFILKICIILNKKNNFTCVQLKTYIQLNIYDVLAKHSEAKTCLAKTTQEVCLFNKKKMCAQLC